MQRIAIFLFALLFPFSAFAQGPPGGCGFPAQPCNIQGTPGGTPTPVVPGTLTYLGKQTFTAATLAASTALTPPATATIANFFPECVSGGTDSMCVRFNPNGTADATTSSGLISSQLYLGETSSAFANYQFILATGATGATGNTLTVYYYK